MISVVIPFYNKSKYIEQTIIACLNQRLPPDEIIIVDDFSSLDEYKKIIIITKKIPKKYLIKVYRLNQNMGASYCRNYGVKKANGEFIFFLDADDMWHSDKIYIHMLNYKDKFIEAIYDNQYSKKKDKIEKINFKIISNNFCENLLSGWGPPNLSSLSIKKKVFEKIGFLDPSLRYSEDQDLYIRFDINNIKVRGLKDRLTYFCDDDKLRVSYASIPRIKGTIDFLMKWEKYFKLTFPKISYKKYKNEYIAKFTYILVINEIKNLNFILATKIFMKYLLFNIEFYKKIKKRYLN